MAPKEKIKIYPPLCTDDHQPCCDYYFSIETQESLPHCSYKGKLSEKEMSRVAADHINSIRKNHDKVKAMVSRNLSEVVKIWKGYNKIKRRKLLEKAYSKLPDTKFLQDLFLHDETDRDVNNLRAECVMHEVNIDTLVDNHGALFALAYNNTLRKPEEYAAGDVRRVRDAMAAMPFDTYYATGCITLYTADPDEYGRLRDFDAEAVHAGIAYPSFLACLALEHRKELLQLVVEVLEPISGTSAENDRSKILENLIKDNFRADQSTSLDWANVIFKPPFLDVQEAYEIALEQYASQKDVFTNLVTNVSTLKEEIRELENYRFREKKKSESVSMSTISWVFRITFQSLCDWHFIVEAFADLASHWKGRTSSGLLDTLPAEYAASLATTYSALTTMLCQATSSLGAQFFNSRAYWDSGLKIGLWSVCATRCKEMFDVDPLSGLVYDLSERQQNAAITIPLIHKLLSRIDQANRINSGVSRLLTQIEVLLRLLEVTLYHLPRCKFNFANTNTSLVHRYLNVSHKHAVVDIEKFNGKLEKLSWKLVIVRPSGQRDREYLGRVDESVALMKKVFLTARQGFIASLKKGRIIQDNGNYSFSDDDCKVIENILSSDEVTNFHPVSPEERMRILSRSVQGVRLQEYPEFIPIPQEPEERFVRPRREKLIGFVEDPVPKEQEEKALEQPLYNAHIKETTTLSWKNFRLIAHLFPTAELAAGQVTFAELARFMGAMGFSRTPMGGSLFRFRNKAAPSDLEGRTDGTKTLLVHKPHPDPSFRPDQLENIGYRIRRDLGWEAEAFAQIGGREEMKKG